MSRAHSRGPAGGRAGNAQRALVGLDDLMRDAPVALARREQRLSRQGHAEHREGYHVRDLGRVPRAEVVGDAGPAQGGDTVDEPAVATADVYVYETIGGWFGMDADDFVRDVAALDVERIVLHLNTPGGDAWEATAMANVLRQHPAEVIVRVDGIAASAGTILAMAGDEIVMGIGSQMMVHDAWSMAVGNAADMLAAARMLDSISNAIASGYAARAGGTAEEWRAVMTAEQWYTGAEAVEAGLADREAGPDDNATATGQQVVPGQSSSLAWWDAWDSLGAADRHDLSMYAHAGREGAPAPSGRAYRVNERASAELFRPESDGMTVRLNLDGQALAETVLRGFRAHTPPDASATGSATSTRGGSAVELTDEQVPQVRSQLGLPENTPRAEVQAALDARLSGSSGPTSGLNLPAGYVPIAQDALDTLRADASAGRQAFEAQQRTEREGLVDAAIRDGRIARAQRESYLSQLTPAGDGAVATTTRELLAALPAGVVPVDTPRGYTGDDGGDPRAQDSAEDVRAQAAYQDWKF